MKTHFEVRQLVTIVNRSWMEVVCSSESERVAANNYHTLVKQYPDVYFELLKVEHNETALVFTANR